MKKSLIALAVLAAAGTASAQSSVTLFGVIDATLNRSSNSGTGGTSLTQLTDSGYNSSRIGLRGTEDLGGGMSASFWLEAGINNDNGIGDATSTNNQVGGQPATGAVANGSQGLTFNRRSTVSLAGSWGELRLGRDYTPSFMNLTTFDPFGTNGVGATMTLVGPASGNGAGAALIQPTGTTGTLVRASNSIGYFLPANLGGFYGQAMYFMGENLGNAGATSNDGDGAGLRVGYAAGPFNVALGWGRTRFATTAAGGDFNTWNIGGQWDFGVAKLLAQYTSDERDSTVSVDGKGWLIGTLIPVGAGEIRASWSQYKIDTNVAGAADPRTRQLAIGYVHNLSKRTAVYTTYARRTNSGGAASGFTSGNTLATGWTANNSSSGWDIGLRHSF